MNTIRFKHWKLQCDSFATREAYEQIAHGGPEDCGCNACKNFAAARRYVYPTDVRELFEELGIDINKEAEVYHNCKLDSGLHDYGGWFHFVGSIEDGADSKRQIAENSFRFDLEPSNDQFAIGFTAYTSLVPESFGDQALVQIEFEAKIPWVIESSEEG
jgi:8-oxo-dGTP pyrophosphatase MutT (NUDIX family)